MSSTDTSTRRRLRMLGSGLQEARIHELVRGRSATNRVLRRLWGRTEPEAVRIERELYWPIALIHATARSTGRRHWVERVQGAVDLVSGRVGLVDLEIPQSREVEVGESDCISARLGRSVAELRWHEFFRDHVDRKHKPMRPPALSVDRIERVWLPNHVVTAGGRRYLVDPLVGRTDELKNFPHVAKMLTGLERDGDTTCKA